MNAYTSSPLRRAITLLGCLSLLSMVVLPSVSLAASRNPSIRTGTVTLRQEVLPSVASHTAVRLTVKDPSSSMAVSLGLPLRHEAELNRFLATEGTTHGAMTHAQFDARYGATRTQVANVIQWARANELKTSYVSRDGLTISLQGATKAVEGALHTRIANYRLGTRRFYANSINPTVPARLGIQTVLGLNNLPVARRLSSVRHLYAPQCPGFKSGDSCYIPKSVRAGYDVSQHGGSGKGQSIGYVLWGAPEKQSDMTAFAKAAGDKKMTVCAVTNSDSNPASCGSKPDALQFIVFDPTAADKDTSGLDETALDVEYSHGIASGVHMKYFMGGDASDADMETAMSAAENDPSLHLISNSWSGTLPGATEKSYLTASTKIFKAADAVGTTFLFATGDQANDSGCRKVPTCGQTVYPTTSPYVLAVGGTDLQLNKGLTGWGSEATWDNWQFVDQDQSGQSQYEVVGGGSGCTTKFARPSFQSGLAAVAANASCKGRAIPDVSADGDSSYGGVLVIYTSGGKTTASVVGGTSLATPLWTGMLADTLHFEATTGVKPFWKTDGFIAPELYKLAESKYYNTYYHDIVCGYNGSAADTGWDQATGLGSPDWYEITLGISGKPVTSTGKAPTSCHLATSSVKTAEGKLSIPQSAWPSGASKLQGGTQPESWLDSSFFSQFKSKKYSAEGALGNFAEQANLKIGSNSKTGALWLGTLYKDSTAADRVVKDSIAKGKATYGLSFYDCSNGYSAALVNAFPNNEDYMTPECQVALATSKESNGSTDDVVYFIFAVGNTVGELVAIGPDSVISASNSSVETYLLDSLNTTIGGINALDSATGNNDPDGPSPPVKLSATKQSLALSAEIARTNLKDSLSLRLRK